MEIELTDIENLRNDTVDHKPRDVGWSEGYPEKWDYYEADECPDCGEIVVGRGNEQHRYIDNETDCEGYVNCEGPMMNSFYPLVSGYDAQDFDPTEAAKKIENLPLCVVEFDEGGEYGLALTGGGMDLSWQICQAHMQLGFLPPVHFANDLPQMSGMEYSDINKWVIDGCRRSMEVERGFIDRGLERLERVEGGLKEESAKRRSPDTPSA